MPGTPSQLGHRPGPLTDTWLLPTPQLQECPRLHASTVLGQWESGAARAWNVAAAPAVQGQPRCTLT